MDLATWCYRMLSGAAAALALHGPSYGGSHATADPLDGRCPYGDVRRVGQQIQIAGGSWDATGNVQADGKTVQVYWTEVATGLTAYGEYEIVGRSLVGRWNWSGAVRIAPGGAQGLDHKETVTVRDANDDSDAGALR